MPANQGTKAEAEARKLLRAAGLEVESVEWIRRGDDDEFAAIVVSNPEYLAAQWSKAEADRHYEREMERVLEVLTDPRCPLRVAHEYVGKTDIRIYVAFNKAA